MAAEAEQNHFKIELPSNVDAQQAAALYTQLLERKNQPVQINAGEVERMSTPALQVLLSASTDWSARDIEFLISDHSESFATALEQLGISGFNLPEN